MKEKEEKNVVLCVAAVCPARRFIYTDRARKALAGIRAVKDHTHSTNEDVCRAGRGDLYVLAALYVNLRHHAAIVRRLKRIYLMSGYPSRTLGGGGRHTNRR